MRSDGMDLTRELLSESGRADYRITTVKDGIDGLRFIHKCDGYEKAPQPDLILLDLNLPRMNGFDFLARIKDDPSLKKIPVCILTTSETKDDIRRAKELQADCYLLKPLYLKEFELTFAHLYTA
jgi:CheY-like chemotaxis protein